MLETQMQRIPKKRARYDRDEWSAEAKERVSRGTDIYLEVLSSCLENLGDPQTGLTGGGRWLLAYAPNIAEAKDRIRIRRRLSKRSRDGVLLGAGVLIGTHGLGGDQILGGHELDDHVPLNLEGSGWVPPLGWPAGAKAKDILDQLMAEVERLPEDPFHDAPSPTSKGGAGQDEPDTGPKTHGLFLQSVKVNTSAEDWCSGKSDIVIDSLVMRAGLDKPLRYRSPEMPANEGETVWSWEPGQPHLSKTHALYMGSPANLGVLVTVVEKEWSGWAVLKEIISIVDVFWPLIARAIGGPIGTKEIGAMLLDLAQEIMTDLGTDKRYGIYSFTMDARVLEGLRTGEAITCSAQVGGTGSGGSTLGPTPPTKVRAEVELTLLASKVPHQLQYMKGFTSRFGPAAALLNGESRLFWTGTDQILRMGEVGGTGWVSSATNLAERVGGPPVAASRERGLLAVSPDALGLLCHQASADGTRWSQRACLSAGSLPLPLWGIPAGLVEHAGLWYLLIKTILPGAPIDCPLFGSQLYYAQSPDGPWTREDLCMIEGAPVEFGMLPALVAGRIGGKEALLVASEVGGQLALRYKLDGDRTWQLSEEQVPIKSSYGLCACVHEDRLFVAWRTAQGWLGLGVFDDLAKPRTYGCWYTVNERPGGRPLLFAANDTLNVAWFENAKKDEECNLNVMPLR